MSETASFSRLVMQTFEFLVRDFQFRYTVPDKPHFDCVIYQGSILDVEFYWGKGELDVILQVKVENEIFRPYVSRAFYLPRVVQRLDKDALQAYPKLPGVFVLSLSDAEKVLQFMADLMKNYCTPILSGDLSLLEKITIEERV